MPGIAFKGTGFYKTDSQKKSVAPSVEKKETSSEAKTEKPTEANQAISPKKPAQPEKAQNGQKA